MNERCNLAHIFGACVVLARYRHVVFRLRCAVDAWQIDFADVSLDDEANTLARVFSERVRGDRSLDSFVHKKTRRSGYGDAG